MSHSAASERAHRAGRIGAAALLGLLLGAGTATAEILDVTSTTLVGGRQDPRDGRLYTVVPVYENLSLQLTDIRARGVEDMKLVVAAWGSVAFGDPREGVATGDVDVGFLEGRLWKKRITFDVGRQIITGGAARLTHIDGLRLSLRLVGGLTISGYAGVPVTPRFGISRGDFQTGGRLFYRVSTNTEAGFSYNFVMDQGLAARNDLAFDGRWTPHRSLALTGYALMSLTEVRLAEAQAGLTWQPITAVQLTAEYRRTAPDLLLPRTSIFAVFSQETRDETGLTLFAQPLRRLRLYGDYHFVANEAGNGHRAGLKVTGTLGRDDQTLLGAEARYLGVPSANLASARAPGAPLSFTNGYVQGRLFAMQRLSKVTITADADVYYLLQPINGTDYSFMGTLTAAYDFSPGWRAAIAGMGDVTPLVQQRFEVMAKLVYNPVFRYREVRR